MNHKANSRLFRRFAALSLMVASIFVGVSFGMKRAGEFNDDRGNNKRPRIENTSRQCPLNQQLIDLKRDNESMIVCSSISPDGHLLAVGYTDGLVKIWNILEGQYTRWLDAKKEGSVLSIEWSRDAKCIATYINEVDSDDNPAIFVWRRNENGTFEGHHAFNMKHDSSADFAFTCDARSFVTINSSCIENRIFDLDKAEEIKKTKQFNKNCLIKKMRITPNERVLLYCFSESANCIISFFQLFDMKCICAFKVAGSLLDCTISPQNNVLVLTKKGFDQTTAVCYKLLITAQGKTLKLLFELKNDNFILDTLAYSSDGAFIVGHAKSQIIGRGTCNSLNASVIETSPTVLVWNCSGILLKKVSFSFENITGELRILDAKIIGSILHIVFSDDNDTWTVAYNLVSTFQCLKDRQYGIQPSLKNIEIQSLRICIDEDKKLSIEIANQSKK